MKIQWARWPDRPMEDCDFFAIELRGYQGEVTPDLFEPWNVYHIIIPKERLEHLFSMDDTPFKHEHPFDRHKRLKQCPHDNTVTKVKDFTNHIEGTWCITCQSFLD